MPFNLGNKVSATATENEAQTAKPLTLSFFKNGKPHSVAGDRESVLFLARRFNSDLISNFTITEDGKKKRPSDFGLDESHFCKWERH